MPKYNNEALLKLENDRIYLELLLKTYIEEYIILYGTGDSEKLFNNVFDDMDINKIKIIPKQHYKISGESPIKVIYKEVIK